jgi:hypothetical protein
MGQKVRRVVTGHNARGHSCILMDGNAPNIMEMASMPGLVVTDLWETKGSPADNRGDKDNADRPVRLEPPPGGSVFRIVEFPPDAAWKGKASGAEAFDSIGAGHAVAEGSDDPMMHVTATTDYAIVLEGEVWAVMEDGETCLRAGDVLVQRGTMHSWSVRTDRPARVAFILVDAAPLNP